MDRVNNSGSSSNEQVEKPKVSIGNSVGKQEAGTLLKILDVFYHFFPIVLDLMILPKILMVL